MKGHFNSDTLNPCSNGAAQTNTIKQRKAPFLRKNSDEVVKQATVTHCGKCHGEGSLKQKHLIRCGTDGKDG